MKKLMSKLKRLKDWVTHNIRGILYLCIEYLAYLCACLCTGIAIGTGVLALQIIGIVALVWCIAVQSSTLIMVLLDLNKLQVQSG